MSIGAYAFFCRRTNECLYVGISENVEARKLAHIRALKNGSHKRREFVAWFQLHGASEESFYFRILEASNKASNLNALEIKWFHLLRPCFYGKEPSLNEKWRHSDETKNKISQSVVESYLKNGKEIRAHQERVCTNTSCFNSFFSHRKQKLFCSRKCIGKYTGKKATHTRWHVKRNLFSEDCSFCLIS